MRVRVPDPVEACFSVRPFTRRRRWRSLRSPSAVRLTFLAYAFKAFPMRLRTRSALRSRLRLAFLPRGERSLLAARCPMPTPKTAVCLRASAPLQDFSIPRDRSALPGSGRRSLPLQVARSSFAPRCLRVIVGCGSLLQIRYFLPGSLSSKPLGTDFIMHPNVFFVNPKCTQFLRIYLACHHAVTQMWQCMLCG